MERGEKEERVDLDRDQWLSTGQASRLAGISPQWALRLAREGRVEAVDTSLGFLIRRSSIEEYARQRAARPTHHAIRTAVV